MLRATVAPELLARATFWLQFPAAVLLRGQSILMVNGPLGRKPVIVSLAVGTPIRIP